MPPIVIAAGIAGAAGIGGALIGSSASSKASQQQVDAGNKALALEQANQAKAEANAAPYQALGQQSLATLGGQAGGYQMNINPKTGQGLPTTVYGGGQPTLAQMSTPQATAPSQAQSQGQPSSDQVVTVMAPDGVTTRQMPMSQAQQFVAKGARIITSNGMGAGGQGQRVGGAPMMQ